MLFVRTVFGTAFAIVAFSIFNALIGAKMGQGGAVLFMLLTMALVTIALRMPLPSPTPVKDEIRASKRHH